ncbi:MAG: FMN-binding protein, partial [Gammaproteobacteria bacterium]|nr:FMN-binding protein [Gammaproteobacteria bacterium]
MSPRVLLASVLLFAGIGGTYAADVASKYPQVREIFPEANRFGAFEGQPRAAAIYRGERLLGYALLTNDVASIPAYSGKPINTLVALDPAGRITGLAIVHHEEPILAVGVTEARLKAFTDQYVGKSAFDRVTVGTERPGYIAVDTISGAT